MTNETEHFEQGVLREPPPDPPLEQKVRVLRVIEYVGPRSLVERQVAQSIHGTKHLSNGLTITAATIGAYPEILTEYQPVNIQTVLPHEGSALTAHPVIEHGPGGCGVVGCACKSDVDV